MTTRRQFLAAAAAPAQFQTRRQRPNIIILLADDLGYGDLGVTGAPDIRTPHLDRLAADGIRFTHSYANAPVCTPTRVALLTGRYQQRAGLSRVIYVDERDIGLDPGTVLLPEVLRPHGYATGIMGKWHLGFPKKYFPTRQGFDEFRGHLSGNIDYFEHVDRLKYKDLWRNEVAWPDPRYMTELISDEAIGFIDRHARDPFFLYVPFNAPHDPFQGPKDRGSQGQRSRAVYGSMVEALDSGIGRILAHLADKGLESNTAVFFQSDNGGLPVVARNTPFRGFKTSLWEGGIRTPLLARWKGQFPAGRTSAEMTAGMDLFPTALEIAGAPPPPKHHLDGVSLLDTCRMGARLQRDTLYFHYQDPSDRVGQQAMVRGGWKYFRDKDGTERLFHLAEDISEQRDLATREPARLTALKKDYDQWLAEVRKGAPPEPVRKR